MPQAEIDRNLSLTAAEELAQIMGPGGYSESLIDMVSYSYNASSTSHRLRTAIWPASAEQINLVLKLAGGRGFAVIPGGAAPA